MAQSHHHDSSLELTFVPMDSGGNGVSPDARLCQQEMRQLNLDSQEPLPDLPLKPSMAEPAGTSASLPLAATSLPLPPDGKIRPSGSFWLQGEVLMCVCPDCSAPMSVRVWLMIADCWQCGTSIELSQEQEREARRLLRERDEALRKQNGNGKPRASSLSDPTTMVAENGPASGLVADASEIADLPLKTDTTPANGETAREGAPSDSTTPRQRKRPTSRRRPRRRAAAERHLGVRAKIRKMAVTGQVRVWISDFFSNLPAWLVSAVFHLVLITILGLLLIDDSQPEQDILLSTEVSSKVREGGDTQAQLPTDEVVFDLPVPNKNWLQNEAKREVLIKADQEAKQLRLAPNDPTTELPPIEKVQQVLKSQDSLRRTFAARDPRMRVEMIKAEGGTTLTEAAVARALRWISLQQNSDGGWGRKAGRSDPAGTSLALLPFLGAGQTHQTGVYKDRVAMGLRWLIRQQTENGDLRGSLTGNNAGMYAHGQGTIVLSEAYALTGDEQLRGPAQKAINFIANAQHTGGGWRYRPKEAGDTSVAGWQLMALHSARASGVNVPEVTVELAGNYLDSVQTAAGSRYAYRRGTAPNNAMTAEGLLCRMYTGWTKSNPALENGLSHLMQQHQPHIDRPNIYYWYYGTQVAHHIGGDPWEQWNVRMRDILVQTQLDSGKFAGAWRPKGPHTDNDDWLYMTSLATCCLEVYYRHAPLFRQLDLEEDEPVNP